MTNQICTCGLIRSGQLPSRCKYYAEAIVVATFVRRIVDTNGGEQEIWNVVVPGPAAQDAPIVFVVEPIFAPFPNVSSEVEKPKVVGSKTADRSGPRKTVGITLDGFPSRIPGFGADIHSGVISSTFGRRPFAAPGI